MKNTIKIVLVLTIVVSLGAVLVANKGVFAENENEQGNQGMGSGLAIGRMMNVSEGVDKAVNNVMQNFGLEIGANNTNESLVVKPNGDFRASGVSVNSISTSTNTINASLYGFSRDLNIAGATIVGAGNNITINDIQTGDKLVVGGNFNEATKAITVSQINDVSARQRINSVNIASIQQRIQELQDMINKLKAQLGQ